MNIKQDFVDYMYDNTRHSHHVLVACNGYLTLLSEINIYLKLKTSQSKSTSQRYSSNIKRFIEFLINEKKSLNMTTIYGEWLKIAT